MRRFRGAGGLPGQVAGSRLDVHSGRARSLVLEFVDRYFFRFGFVLAACSSPRHLASACSFERHTAFSRGRFGRLGRSSPVHASRPARRPFRLRPAPAWPAIAPSAGRIGPQRVQPADSAGPTAHGERREQVEREYETHRGEQKRPGDVQVGDRVIGQHQAEYAARGRTRRATDGTPVPATSRYICRPGAATCRRV